MRLLTISDNHSDKEEVMGWRLTLTTAALVLGAAIAAYGIAADAPESSNWPIMMPEVLVQAPRPDVVVLPEIVVTARPTEPCLLPAVAVRAPRPEILLLDTVRIEARRIELRDRARGSGAVSSVRRIHARIRAARAQDTADGVLPAPGPAVGPVTGQGD
jgi:hypothetical protein